MVNEDVVIEQVTVDEVSIAWKVRHKVSEKVECGIERLGSDGRRFQRLSPALDAATVSVNPYLQQSVLPGGMTSLPVRGPNSIAGGSGDIDLSDYIECT